MHNQLLRGLIFVILVFLVTSDLKEIISTLATSSSISAFLQRQSSPAAQSSSHNQRSKRHASTTSGIHQTEVDGRGGVHGNEEEFMSTGSSISSLKLKPSSTSSSAIPGGDGDPEDSSNFNDYDSLHADRKINGKGAHSKKKIMKLNDDEKKELLAMKTQLTAVMQEWCLPKLVCELHASVSERGSLTEAEKGLLSLIRETSLGTMGEVVSRYHFAAHMGQLLSGVEGNGCHNFYPNCPLSGSRVLQMMKKVRIR